MTWEQVQDKITETLEGDIGVYWQLKQIDKCSSNDDPRGCVYRIDQAVNELLSLKKAIEERAR